MRASGTYVPVTEQEWLDAFWQRAVPVPRTKHRQWKGAYNSTGTALLCLRKERRCATRIAFKIAHGREPVGYVKPGCGRAGCFEPTHMSDRRMREALQQEMERRARYEDIDKEAVRRCLLWERGPYPPLNPTEQRYAFRLSEPGTPPGELAVRLGMHPRTVSRWRDKGIPK